MSGVGSQPLTHIERETWGRGRRSACRLAASTLLFHFLFFWFFFGRDVVVVYRKEMFPVFFGILGIFEALSRTVTWTEGQRERIRKGAGGGVR